LQTLFHEKRIFLAKAQRRKAKILTLRLCVFARKISHRSSKNMIAPEERGAEESTKHEHKSEHA